MDVKLKVLGGAKSGLEIPLKKDEFTIGRSSECTLRAGSDAISRKHCIIRLGRSTIKIADLGSRNGTFVNGKRIDQETPLSSGDEVRVGPLRFEVVAQHGLDSRKRPEVQGIGEAVVRIAATAGKPASLEESIDNWLTEPARDSQLMHDTTSLRLDETQGGQVRPAQEARPQEEEAVPPEEDVLADDSVASSKPAESAAESAAGSSSIKRKDKKEPGKLPSRPKGPTTKDSREAAAEVLRAMTRRR